MSLGNNSMSNQEIKTSLISIYDKINKPPTKEVGYDLFLKLVHKNLYSSPQMNFIINHIGEFIFPLTPKEKDPCIKLLSLIFYSPSNEDESFDTKIYYPYLSPVLSILQNLIRDTNSPIFPTISNIFAEIVQNIMPTDIEASNIELDEEEKTAYEMLQGFCIYNMKYDDKSNRIVGSLCLTKLVENCPIVLQKQYMKLIWEVIINLIDKKNFNAKYELLNCLISLILGAENLFTPYAHNTLYKVLDFLADTDWLKRKLALNVIYTLIFYCKEEILPLKEHIISFLRALKTDKVKEVREVCLLILKIFSENEQKNKETKTKTNNINNNNKKKFANKNNDSKAKMKKPNIKDKTPVKKANNTHRLSKNSESDKSNSNNNFSNKFSECVVPDVQEKDNKEKEKDDFNINESEENSNQSNSNKNRISSPFGGGVSTMGESEINNNISNNINSIKKPGFNTTIKNAPENKNINKDTNNDITAISQTKFVNRKDDKTFINEKMVIKPDPNKSIFKSNPNPAFFNQANKQSKDIVLVSKGEPKKAQNNNKIEKIEEVNNEDTNNEQIDIKLEPPKIVEKKDINKKVPTKNNNNNDSEVNKEKKIDNQQATNNNINNNNKNENKNIVNNINNTNNNKIKEKAEKVEKVEQPPVKNKAGPIIRNKKLKRNQDKEEHNNNIEQQERKKTSNENKKQLTTNYKKDNSNKKKEFNEDDNINDYKSYLNKNENKKVKKENETEINDPNIINTLLSQMNSLSEKQLSLIDVMDNIQMETQGQIKDLNKRITKLERNIEELNNELYDLKNDN